MWWRNRVYTVRVLNGAATLAFARLLDGNERYGRLAKRLLLDAAKWDPKGSTNLRYNDEAGMPYAYHFARTYTFLHGMLTDEERQICRQVLKARGQQLYSRLHPRHIWRPYSSHANRMWHFLGEVGIACLDEVPEAADWLWYAMNVFYNAYPVWRDDDGGWHEGMAYWRSYIGRFLWWADVMRVAMDIDAFAKPYFAEVGYYPMYLQPPGTKGGGFGDLTARLDSAGNVALMRIFAAQANNPYWQWYVDAHGGGEPEPGYIGLVRRALPKVEPKAPTDLPASRCFRGTGQAVLNTNLLDAKNNVQIIFKSSPFGTQSHGYEANNSFLLYAFGERLLIRSGRRDRYGSAHHKNWMWHTKSVNCITVNGEGQTKRSAKARGEIVAFETSAAFDYVAGEAGPAYEGKLDRFTRHILFLKPELIVILDQLTAPQAATFEWRLHAPTEMRIDDDNRVHVANGDAACVVSFLAPGGLRFSQTNKFDPPPRPRIKLVEWHLAAVTASPSAECEFVTVLRPHRKGRAHARGERLAVIQSGYALEAEMTGGRAVVLLRTSPRRELKHGNVATDGHIAAVCFDKNGRPTARFLHGGTRLNVLTGK